MAFTRLEAKVQFPGLGKEDIPEPLVIPGGGLARRLLAACQDRGMQVLARDGHSWWLFQLPSSFNLTESLPCDCLTVSTQGLVLLKFCAEGDNTQDAIQVGQLSGLVLAIAST